jgi:hypothetical protein
MTGLSNNELLTFNIQVVPNHATVFCGDPDLPQIKRSSITYWRHIGRRMLGATLENIKGT